MRYISRTDIERGKAERRAREADAHDLAHRRRDIDVAEVAHRNRHNFDQLQAAGFPGTVPIEVLSWTSSIRVAKFLEFCLKYDVEYGVEDTRHQLVRRRRMLGYPIMPAAYGNTQDWNGSPPTVYDEGLVLTTEGEVHPIHRNSLDDRGCLVVDVVDMYPTLGTVDSPGRLPREFSYHLYELSIQTLHEAGVEYQPVPELHNIPAEDFRQ